MRRILRHSTVFLMSLLMIVPSALGQQVFRFRTPDATYTVNLSDSLHGAWPAGATIPLWNGSFDFEGTTYPFTMVGSDPSVQGTGTSKVAAVLIPVRFKFGSTVISPIQKACGDSVSVLSRVRSSPLFSSQVTWTAGATILGKTQYADAFQRANFWNFVSSISPQYHVMLNPLTVTPVQTVNVPPSDGFTLPGSCGNRLGVVDIGFWLSQAQALLTKLAPPTAVAIFITYDMGQNFMGGNPRPMSGLGVEIPSEQTFVIGSYTEPNAFIQTPGNISVLSAVLADWVVDPLLFSDRVPPWGHIGLMPGCEDLMLSTAPLGTTYPVTQKGFTYDVAEAAFLSWFARQSPSTAVNGWYSSQNTLTAPPPICQ